MKILLPLLATLVASSAFAQQPASDANQTRVQRDTYSSGTISRTTAQVDERKFIGIGMSRASVLSKLGEPDRRIVWLVTYIASQTTSQEPYIDIYEPARGDDQTRTRITYVGDSVSNVEREVVR